MKKVFLFLAAISYASNSFAATATNTVMARPCTIFVHSYKNSGERSVSFFTTKLRSRMECVTLAQIHYPNYDSDTVKAKRVVYMWDFVPRKKNATVKRGGKSKRLVANYKRR